MVVMPGQYRLNEDGSFIYSACEAALYREALDNITSQTADPPIIQLIKKTIDEVEGAVSVPNP
jgi:hypothetical protein